MFSTAMKNLCPIKYICAFSHAHTTARPSCSHWLYTSVNKRDMKHTMCFFSEFFCFIWISTAPSPTGLASVYSSVAQSFLKYETYFVEIAYFKA